VRRSNGAAYVAASEGRDTHGHAHARDAVSSATGLRHLQVPVRVLLWVGTSVLVVSMRAGSTASVADGGGAGGARVRAREARDARARRHTRMARATRGRAVRKEDRDDANAPRLLSHVLHLRAPTFPLHLYSLPSLPALACAWTPHRNRTTVIVLEPVKRRR
jgi:hypothetical protein